MPKTKKPKMWNQFYHEKTGLYFTIPNDKQVTVAEATTLMNQSIQKERERLFVIWKSRKENGSWQGDVETKKDELFSKLRRRGSEIVLWRAS